MSYEVLTLSTRTTFLDTVLYLEASTEQVPSLPLLRRACSNQAQALTGEQFKSARRPTRRCYTDLLAAINRGVKGFA